MMVRRFVFASAVALSATLASVLPAQTSEPVAPQDNLDLRFANGIAAVVEEKVITVDDIRREIAPLLPQIQRESRNEKEFADKLEALQEEIIQNLVDRVLIVKDFRKDEKKRIPASFVDNQISEELITRFDGDRSKFLAYLRQRGLTMREYRREIEEEIIYNYMRQQQRKSASIISPVRVETFYNENLERFNQEDQVHLRLIQFTRTEGQTDAFLRARAQEVIGRLERGEKFADLAKEYSQDSRRNRGGDWGWQKRSDLKPEFSTPLFALSKDQVTEPIIQPEGAFLLYVEDRKYAGVQPIEEVRDQIERILVTQMARQSTERWLERLRRGGYVKLF